MYTKFCKTAESKLNRHMNGLEGSILLNVFFPPWYVFSRIALRILAGFFVVFVKLLLNFGSISLE